MTKVGMDRNQDGSPTWAEEDSRARILEVGAPAIGASELRVLCVIPGQEQDASAMPYVRRQVEALPKYGVTAKAFFQAHRRSASGAWRELGQFRETIRAWRPALVHAHFGGLTAAFCALGANVPLMITFRGSDLNPAPGDGLLLPLIRVTLSRLAVCRARQIVCVSEQLRRRLGPLGRRACVIPTGVRMELFQPRPRAEARRQLGWGEEPVALINVRDDPVGKRLDLAEDALAWVRQRLPAARLEVLRGNRVPSKDMPLYYSAADCLLMMSDFEGSPNVVKESLACNLPVVSVDVGDVSERLQGVTHSAIVARDAVAIGTATWRILDSLPRSNGRERVAAVDEGCVARQLVDLYRRVSGILPQPRSRAA